MKNLYGSLESQILRCCPSSWIQRSNLFLILWECLVITCFYDLMALCRLDGSLECHYLTQIMLLIWFATLSKKKKSSLGKLVFNDLLSSVFFMEKWGRIIWRVRTFIKRKSFNKLNDLHQKDQQWHQWMNQQKLLFWVTGIIIPKFLARKADFE